MGFNEVITIGHSNRSMEDFLALLKEFEVRAIVDIRRFPSSRKFPHFNRGNLQEELSQRNVEYSWLESLGGRRHSACGNVSPNEGLKRLGFRSYADHMLTEEFHLGVEEILGIARCQRTAVMCAEKLFWSCHRRLLSDFLYAQGVVVQHILEPGKLQEHRFTLDARIVGKNVLYPLPLIAAARK